MARADLTLIAALKKLGSKPPDTAPAGTKKNWTEQLSNRVAQALAEELRARGLSDVSPVPAGAKGGSGAERRMSGGIGAKDVDITWTTQDSGLLLAISVKTISFKDQRSKNFQKNLTNRRGDMLFESVTLHRRFPYAVLGGVLILDRGAARDSTPRRKSTFENAMTRFKLFTGRDDPGGRDEQYERLWIMLLDATKIKSASATSPPYKIYAVPDHRKTVTLKSVLDELVGVIPDRNPDFYELKSRGELRRLR